MVLHPRGPPVLRLGIGACHFMLNNMDKARQAFNRVLQLDTENVDALVALAMIDLNSGDGTQAPLPPNISSRSLVFLVQLMLCSLNARSIPWFSQSRALAGPCPSELLQLQIRATRNAPDLIGSILVQRRVLNGPHIPSSSPLALRKRDSCPRRHQRGLKVDTPSIHAGKRSFR